MSEKHGKGSKILIGHHDFSGKGRSLDISIDTDTVDITTFDDDAKEYLAGQSMSKIAHKGIFDVIDSGWDAYMHSLLGSYSSTPLTVVPGKPSDGGTAYNGEIIKSKLGHKIAINDVIATDAEYQINGPLSRAIIIGESMTTTAGNSIGTAVNLGECDGENMYQYTIHVVSSNINAAAGSGTMSFVVQHASNNVSASFATFTSLAVITSSQNVNGSIVLQKTSGMQFQRLVVSRVGSGTASYIATAGIVPKQS